MMLTIFNEELKGIHIDEFISRLSEMQKLHGNREVVIEIEVELVADEEDYTAIGYPRELRFDEKDGKVKVVLKNCFEV